MLEQLSKTYISYVLPVWDFFQATFYGKDFVRGREDILPDWGHSWHLISESFF